MAKSTSVVLAATAISFGNEWIQTNELNFRVLVAGGFVGLLFAGVEQLNEKAGVGLSVIMLVTVLVTPFNGKSPMQTLADVSGAPNNKKGNPNG